MNIETLAAFKDLQEFVNYAHKGHIKLFNNSGLPGYNGFGSGATNLNEGAEGGKQRQSLES